MNPEELDRAIDALPDSEHKELSDAAIQHWSFRAQTWAMALGFFAAAFLLFYAMRALIQPYWPGSLVAGALATLAWCFALLGLLRFVTSMRVTQWRIRWATRREYKGRIGAA